MNRGRFDFPIRMVLGLPLAALDMSGALRLIEAAIRSKGHLNIGVVNAAKIIHMRNDASLAAAVLDSDVIFADGMSVVWASRLLGASLPERVAGIDLMMNILERGNQEGYRVYLLGATEDVSQAVEERIKKDYPGVVVAGRHNGYFKEHEEAAIARDIAASRADVLFVAMTSPKKEKFLAKWGAEMNVRVCHGVGGSFDVYAGLTRRAPLSWQRFGLEWLYRLLQEPRRMWKRYLYTNAAFVALVCKEYVRKLAQPSEISNSSAKP